MFGLSVEVVVEDCERRKQKMLDEMSLAELLKEIEEKRGAYSRDHLTHASNCIEHMSKCATEFKKRLRDLLIGSTGNPKFGYIRKESQTWYFIKEILGE